MFSPSIYGENWFEGHKLSFKSPIDIYVNHFFNYRFNDNFKVLLAFSEPPGFRATNEEIIAYRDLFNLILTYDETILLNCKNAVKFLFGTSLINRNEGQAINAMEKEFKVSYICGNKKSLPGHLLRLNVWKRQREINIPKVFWISSQGHVEPIDNNPVYPASLSWNKILLFKQFQFHIAIENSQYKNYFTEKLCDCFRTKTVPIYWGAPNIDDFFDAGGIITFKDEDELIRICNALTPDDYFKKQTSIINKERIVEDYCESVTDRLQKTIPNFLL